MPIRIEQTPEMEPGEVRLVRSGPGAVAPGTAEISIARLDMGSPRYLDPRYIDKQAWGAGERWFRPDAAAEAGGALRLGLGPAATWQLKPHMPYLVRLRDESGQVIEDRMSWPVVRLPSSAPPPSQMGVIETEKPAPAPEPEPAPAPEPEPDPLEYFAELEAETPAPEPEPAPIVPEPVVQREPERRRGPWLVLGIIGALLMLMVGALGYLWFYERDLLLANLPPEIAAMLGDEPQETPPPAPSEPDSQIELTLDGAYGYLRTKPPAAEATAEAARFAEAGQQDAAFVILKYAARAGDGAASDKLGDIYNPATFTPGGVVPAADANYAAELYLDAVKAGTKDALYKAGQMLKDGKVTDQTIAGRVGEALKAAADAGDAKARELL